MNILSFEVIFAFALGIGYFFFFILKELKLSTFFGSNSESADDDSARLGFSVIIACKDEEKNIPHLLSAIEAIEYPNDKCEFIVVDDNSSDKTLALLKAYTPHNKSIRVLEAGNKAYPAKKGALDVGIKKAVFENIMITDADCSPQRKWLHQAEKCFLGGNDIVFGLAPYRDDAGFVRQFFCYEQFTASTHYFSAALAGQPYSAAARNFGFTKSVYAELGGFSGTLQSLGGDDDLFLLTAVNHHKRIAVIPFSEHSLPISDAPQNWRSYFKQRSRHVKTSHHYRFSTQVGLSVFHGINYASLISIFFCWISPVFLIPTLLKTAGDVYLAKKYARFFSYHFGLPRIVLFIFLYEISIPVNFGNSLFRPDKWK